MFKYQPLTAELPYMLIIVCVEGFNITTAKLMHGLALINSTGAELEVCICGRWCSDSGQLSECI